MLMNDQLLNLIMRSIEKTGWIDLPADGNSMFPLIAEGNLCRFEKCDPAFLKKGDVALFRFDSGELVAHRYCKTVVKDGKEHYIFKGDTNLGYDEPVPQENVVGRLISIQKGTFKIRLKHHVLATTWGTLILKQPWLSGILRSYLNRKSRLQY